MIPNNTKYPEMYDYYLFNEYDNPINDPDGILPSVLNDERNENLLQEIVDYLNDEELLHDLSTGLILDMFKYYTKHGKDFTPVEFDYEK